jgi:[ribosomal protein S5]-alanine N-acetyltransferase
MDSTDPLVTDRLMLTRVSWRDAPFIFRLLGNAEVRQYLGGVVPVGRRLQTIRHYLQCGVGEMIWTVKIVGSQIPVGLMSITKHKDGQDVELSYEFIPDFWGQGYAFEAASTVLRYAREQLRLQRVIAETQAANAASCNLLKRLGMDEMRRLKRFGHEQVIFSTKY